jgi:isoleucyl-tRNA synthetase
MDLKIIPAAHVTSDSGTGLVQIAPAHGFDDYNAFRSLGLLESNDILCHVDGAGKFTEDIVAVVGDAVAKDLVHQPVFGIGSEGIVKLLQEIGRLVKLEKVQHRYPYDWRTNKPVIVRLAV